MPILAAGFVLRACTLSFEHMEKTIQQLIPPSEAAIYGQAYLPCSWSTYDNIAYNLISYARDYLVVIGFRDPSPTTGLSGGLDTDAKVQELHQKLACATRSWPRVSNQEREVYSSDPESDLNLPLQARCLCYEDLGAFVVRHERLLDDCPSFTEKWELTNEDYAGLGKPDRGMKFGDWDKVLEALGLTDEQLLRDQIEREVIVCSCDKGEIGNGDLVSSVRAMTLG